jgi:hypothetical protein
MLDLNDENVLMYAIKCYDRPGCLQSEFESDYKRFKYIKRLVNKYRNTGEIKERLILNHLIILGNVFGIEATVRILFFKLPEVDYKTIKTFLIFLNYMPKQIVGVKEKPILSSDIPLDWTIVEILRQIKREV